MEFHKVCLIAFHNFFPYLKIVQFYFYLSLSLTSNRFPSIFIFAQRSFSDC